MSAPVVLSMRVPGTAAPPPLPPLPTQVGNLGKAVARSAWRLVTGRPVVAPAEVRDARRAVCRSNVCGKYRERGNRCALCGCRTGGVLDKTMWAGEECPHPRRFWRAVETNTTTRKESET